MSADAVDVGRGSAGRGIGHTRHGSSVMPPVQLVMRNGTCQRADNNR